ncbi:MULTISPECIES: nucleotide exchange factor GrpE [unclassified Dolichospermum]|uniref:nucleotide exchange factor GrpE n=1 Tax=unclassified Dolichospermum TaxID=2622029 RepID=UPI001447815E|nr:MULTISPECIES: molecular chaperone GrpE [unclassified Dolichospermum]MBO1052241.1 molecular chaperone GrpE [Dolichospermum sp. DET73]MTJ15898.1 molecular chaperone GrpE [Dolichospermum sp. UHCC 0299]MTJ20255.1 molecular chaperone GrpE [Dolichospermum sp. UHCC 0352]MTJ41678.1 molecular chaperone GrpE [Dolichospermum sp. UHCC 0406]
MLEQINQVAFAVILVIIVYIILRFLFPANNQNTSINNQPVTSPDTEQKIKDLEIQCQRLREELKQQSQQLQTDFQQETFTQLQTLLSNYPTVKKMALAKPELPAKNLTFLFTSLDNLITNWGYTAIGETWKQVNYNPQLHQADSDDIQEGELVYIRFIGYQNGDKVLYPAKVSRTLPGGFDNN